jgi:hypothetical protein
MKIVAIIARILLGLMFFVFGLNPFLKFLPMPQLEGVWGSSPLTTWVAPTSHTKCETNRALKGEWRVVFSRPVRAAGDCLERPRAFECRRVSRDDAATWSPARCPGCNLLAYSVPAISGVLCATVGG